MEALRQSPAHEGLLLIVCALQLALSAAPCGMYRTLRIDTLAISYAECWSLGLIRQPVINGTSSTHLSWIQGHVIQRSRMLNEGIGLMLMCREVCSALQNVRAASRYCNDMNT